MPPKSELCGIFINQTSQAQSCSFGKCSDLRGISSLAAKVSDIHRVYDDDTPQEQRTWTQTNCTTLAAPDDIYMMIIAVMLWNFQMTRDRCCGHRMSARVCKFSTIWQNFIPVPHIY